MSQAEKRIKVLGIGNPLFQDEGFGIAVAHELMKQELPSCVEVIDGGTDGLALLSVVEEAEKLIVIDAVNDDQNPGNWKIYRDSEIPAGLSMNMSVHQLAFSEVLALCQLRGSTPSETVLFGYHPVSLEMDTGLTHEGQCKSAEVLTAVKELIISWAEAI